MFYERRKSSDCKRYFRALGFSAGHWGKAAGCLSGPFCWFNLVFFAAVEDGEFYSFLVAFLWLEWSLSWSC